MKRLLYWQYILHFWAPEKMEWWKTAWGFWVPEKDPALAKCLKFLCSWRGFCAGTVPKAPQILKRFSVVEICREFLKKKKRYLNWRSAQSSGIPKNTNTAYKCAWSSWVGKCACNKTSSLGNWSHVTVEWYRAQQPTFLLKKPQYTESVDAKLPAKTNGWDLKLL